MRYYLATARTLAHLHDRHTAGFIGVSLPYKTDEQKKLADAIVDSLNKLHGDNPTCGNGHNRWPLALWNCPECTDGTRRLAVQLAAALKRMDTMHGLLMKKTNHGASFYDAECFHEMNEAPLQAASALEAAQLAGLL